MSAKPDPCRPRAVDEKTSSITHVLLVAVAIAMMQGVGNAELSSSERETALPSSTTSHGRSADNDSISIRHGSLDQEASSPCSSRVPDPIHRLICADGANPLSGVTIDASGNLFGTTLYGGTNSGAGTLYKIKP